MYLITIIMLLIGSTSCCPSSCICKWKNGKQTVECSDRDLLIIPEGVEPDTQVLHFSGNNLQTLHAEKFLRLGLINLQRIYLSRCKVSYIQSKAFNGLTNLVELDLSENKLIEVSPASFEGCGSLMKLYLHSNPIKTLQKDVFSHLPLLNTLDLSSCAISSIAPEAFRGLFSLEWLNLGMNKLSTLPVYHNLPLSLKGVQLQGNPWICDCNISGLQKWLKSFGFPLSSEPVCAEPPEFFDVPIKSVPKYSLACLPEIEPKASYIEVQQGRNISLICQVNATPPAMISWYFEGELIRNNTVYVIDISTEGRYSELFIEDVGIEDNGTFICEAENAAGISRANFTVKVHISKSLGETEELYLELILLLIAAALLLVLLLSFVVITYIVKHKRSLKQKRHVTYKESSSEDETINIVDNKAALGLKSVSLQEKPNNTQFQDLAVLKMYQEQNPDLINGTESIGAGDNEGLIGGRRFVRRSLYGIKEESCMYDFQNDVRLDPLGLMTNAGRAVIPGEFKGNCYNTLPGRLGASRNAALPPGRVTKEAEFLATSGLCIPFQPINCIPPRKPQRQLLPQQQPPTPREPILKIDKTMQTDSVECAAVCTKGCSKIEQVHTD
ncbi:unnamed protein product [Acanthoscelides obtectus]|uniref:Ig-like domain-containing protein n=1 Tax=Acanthoscelides obtectus TaxID=200917 RepID=A0A9P0P9J6_ACAOB|nr:unnamed protein product [Acanthoscelides obtectus]CAK1635775.1 Leucine-rich repeat-containing protein 24 [Acanthoscelides obtectus]